MADEVATTSSSPALDFSAVAILIGSCNAKCKFQNAKRASSQCGTLLTKLVLHFAFCILNFTHQFTAFPPNVRPSASVIETKIPPGSPLLSGLMTTVTLSPGFSSDDRQPFLTIEFGLPSSTPQRSVPPDSFGTSS